MDGSVRDLIVDGSRVRLASSDFAAKAFPAFVLAMCCGRLAADTSSGPDGVRLVRMTELSGDARLTVLSQDFDRIASVAVKFGSSPRLFPGEPDSGVLARMAAELRARFADRPAF